MRALGVQRMPEMEYEFKPKIVMRMYAIIAAAALLALYVTVG
jgi:hypothetical protein